MISRLLLLAVLALLAWFGMGRAHAGACGLPYLGEAGLAAGSGQTYPTLAEAGAACSGIATATADSMSGMIYEMAFSGCRVDGSTLVADYSYTGARFAPAEGCKNYPVDPASLGQAGGIRGWEFGQGCPAGTTWNPETGTCFDPAVCETKPPLGFSKITGGSATACSGGCQYGPPGGVSVSFPADGGLTFVSGWEPTGGTCAAGDASPEPVEDPQACTPVDGQSMCVKPNGDHCYSASTGRQICWKPGETGEKTDGDVLQKRNAGPDAQPPTTKIPDGESLQQSGDPLTSTTTTTTNNSSTTTTTTTTNYTTTNGTDAGGGTGTGDSGEPGDGSGDGEGDGEGDEDGPGSPSAQPDLGRMPGADGRTLAGVLAAHRTRMSNAPIMSAAAGFFTVQAGGTCPVWVLPATDWTPAIPMDYWCLSELGAMWAGIGLIMLVVFAWAAFRIAML